MTSDVFLSGKLRAGCNYWASHAGICMWRSWSAEIVEKDFKLMAEHGISVLRVFPLWEDFQPVEQQRTIQGKRQVCVHAVTGKPLAPGGDGLDPEMLRRFRVLADLAQKYDLQLIVALLTGWMSGRLFVPRVLENCNLFTDPEALRWERRFIRGFVSALKDHPAIIAWEPGNECNCLSAVANDQTGEAAAWHWLDFISSAIRCEDPQRPVWTGMHTVAASLNTPWNLYAQGELYDCLTTHPYPLFTPSCGRSPLNTVPAVLHSTAETLFYRGISGKPAIVEEVGTLGPCIASEERRCGFLRSSMISAYVHDCLAYIWWCAFDQGHLDYAPYTWAALERELGLFAENGIPHPAAKVMAEVMAEIEALPLEKLPPRRISAAVISTECAEQWKTAYGAFTLAKQAGIEIEFASVQRPLPDSGFYWMPAVSGSNAIGLVRYNELIARVKNGAVLLVTDPGSAVLQPFADVFGCRIDYRSLAPDSYSITCGEESFFFKRENTHRLLAGDAQILAVMDDNSPALTCFPLGKGKVYYLNAAPELQVLDEKEPHFYKLYRFIARHAGLDIPEKSPGIGRTVHPLPDGRELIVEINYTDQELDGIAANGFRFSGI